MSENTSFNKILDEFEISANALYCRKHRSGLTYSKIYDEMVRDAELVLEVQNILVNVSALDLKQLFLHKKYAYDTANSIMNGIYGVDVFKPIDVRTVNNCKYIKEKLIKK